jgi:hypothetical protein
MKRVLLVAVAALAFGGSALAQNMGPPPPPQFHCEGWQFWGRFAGNYINGCQRGYAMRMQRWRDQMDYWRAMQQYRERGN